MPWGLALSVQETWNICNFTGTVMGQNSNKKKKKGEDNTIQIIIIPWNKFYNLRNGHEHKNSLSSSLCEQNFVYNFGISKTLEQEN